MKSSLSKTEVKTAIDNFFRKSDFKPEELKKIRRLAMKYKIRLGEYKKLFCKSCLNPLRGKTRISKGYKTVVCQSCNQKNKFRISL